MLIEAKIPCRTFVCRKYNGMDREVSAGYLLKHVCKKCGYGGEEGYENCRKNKIFASVRVENGEITVSL